MAATRTPFAVADVKWQDYRAAQTGMVVYYTSDPVSEIPIREVPEDLDSLVPPEPHYETGTYGLYACARPKVRTAFVKNKVRYLFFVTKYEGTNADYRGKYLITGMYHICRTADARRFHIRYCREYECLEVGTCVALRADTVHFVGLTDAFEVTADVLKGWNYNAKLNRQTRIILDAVHTKTLLEYLQAKPEALKAYLDETVRLQPHGAEEEADEGEGEGEEAVAEAPAARETAVPGAAETEAVTADIAEPAETPAEPVQAASEAVPAEEPVAAEEAVAEALSTEAATGAPESAAPEPEPAPEGSVQAEPAPEQSAPASDVAPDEPAQPASKEPPPPT
jgi:hypothetical protein